MPDETDAIDAALTLTFGQTVDDRVTYRADPLFVLPVKSGVGSVHVSDVAGQAFSPCGCCPTGCELVPCVQCVNGYGPRVINFTWKPASPAEVGVVWWENGAKISAFTRLGQFNATGDCVWEATSSGAGFYYGSSWSNAYVRLFYSGGWKVFFDYFPSATGDLADYVPSGNGVTFDLDSAFDCSSMSQTILITQSAGPTLLTSWNIFGSDAGDAIPRRLVLSSCGNQTSAADCCTERIPFRMSLTFTGCPALAAERIALDHSGAGAWASDYYALTSTVALGISYSFQLTCEKYPTAGDPFTWVMRVYDLTTGGAGTLVYTGVATSATCYPVHLTFASAGLHFPNYWGGTDLCNGVAFVMHVTV